MKQDASLQSLLDAGKLRLYPRITNPNWLVLRKRTDIFRRWLQQMPLRSANVLDVGGSLQPYRALLPTPHHYWSVDLCRNALVSVVGSAELLPFADHSFDLVLCTQMLQYAAEPAAVAHEIHRVLRPHGVLLLSAPSIVPRDSELDRWRFFPLTLKQLLANFSEVEVVAEGGSAAGFLRTAGVFIHVSARYPVLRTLVGLSVIPAINLLGAAIESMTGANHRDGTFTANYSVFAKK